jgi:hypothetical protein
MLKTVPSIANRILPRSRRAQLTTVVAALAMVVVIMSVTWAINIGNRAQTLAKDLQFTAGAAQSTIGTADADAIGALSLELEAASIRAQELNNDLWPMRVIGSFLGWYPVLGDNITAPADMVDRLAEDVRAALEIVRAAERLVRTYELVPQQSAGITEVLASLPDEDVVNEIREIILTSDAALSRAEGTANGIHDRRLWGRLETEAKNLRAQEETLRELIDWTLLATDSLIALKRLADVSADLSVLLDSGDASELGGDTLGRMPQLAAASALASSTVSAAVASSPPAVNDSVIGSNLRDLEPVLDALHATARGGAIVASVVAPAFESMKMAGGGLFGSDSALLVSISQIGDGDGQLREAERLLVNSGSQLAIARSRIETPSIASAADSLLLLSRDLGLAVSLLRDLPELAPDALGANGERRYLVLAESADELRPSGGFVSGAWVLTFDDGMLMQSTYLDVIKVDDVTNLERYPAPPDLLANHMDAPVWLLRDVSWEPDFPSVARSAADILEIGQDGLRVDGVIATTQWAMLDLAAVLGSIETPEGRLPSDGLLTTLESGTDEAGREFMNTLFNGLLTQINEPGVSDHMFQLVRAASKSLAEKQMLVNLFDADLQEIVARAGWDGAVPRGEMDRVAIFDSNVGWSKVDRNIGRSVEYDVELKRSMPSIGTLTVRYTNSSDESASSCDSQQMDRGRTYERLKNACYWNLIRIYPATGASLITAEPIPLPDNSIVAKLGLAATGDNTVAIGIGPSGRFMSGLLTVPAGETVETSFVFELPESTVSWTNEVSTYSLNLTAQPGALGRATRIRIELPPGQAYAGGSIIPSLVDGRTVSFELQLREDTLLTVAMQPIEAAMGLDPPLLRRSVAETLR